MCIYLYVCIVMHVCMHVCMYAAASHTPSHTYAKPNTHTHTYTQVEGSHILITHSKKRLQQLHLTPEGFVFLGEPSYFQVCMYVCMCMCVCE